MGAGISSPDDSEHDLLTDLRRPKARVDVDENDIYIPGQIANIATMPCMADLMPSSTFQQRHPIKFYETREDVDQRRKSSVTLIDPSTTMKGRRDSVAGPGHSALFDSRLESLLNLCIEHIVHTAIGEVVQDLYEDVIWGDMAAHQLCCENIIDTQQSLSRITVCRRTLQNDKACLARVEEFTQLPFRNEPATVPIISIYSKSARARTSTTTTTTTSCTSQQPSASAFETAPEEILSAVASTIYRSGTGPYQHRSLSFLAKGPPGPVLDDPNNAFWPIRPRDFRAAMLGTDARLSEFESRYRAKWALLQSQFLHSHATCPPSLADLNLTVGQVLNEMELQAQAEDVIEHSDDDADPKDIIRNFIKVLAIVEGDVKVLRRELNWERSALECRIMGLDFRTRVSGRLRRTFESNQNKVLNRVKEAYRRMVEVVVFETKNGRIVEEEEEEDYEDEEEEEGEEEMWTEWPGKKGYRIDSAVV